ncbi:phosphatidylserine/phosphatidylglycerophosphate/cardiolipin synthase-like enzyme [Mycobacterium sp. OAS707]|uniref:phospholipase D family protein n=1 Tax=Mycobacterium sp. OAS707 TaxID=2663822 RepID=UPI001789485D|nr:phospholipase D-like domain-containing protein [Mycobacterium sp. OAS707]MBE1548768.1 phosphatidylserine/phosphatidylglycerophosphate/cardiolipin synthase-like enzyme [Mycobacterium sp. OAS707]
MSDRTDWFLTEAERGNPASKLPAWCEGNRVEPLIHGATYFDRLATEVEALGAGDHLFFTDWRGDPDQKMRDDGPTIRELFTAAAKRGVVVKGLVWRSHLDKFAYSEEENQHLGEAIEEAGGEVLLDQRVRFGGSHHQKLVVLRHPEDPSRDVAFAGGIDLCHSRRDDAEHRGDRQAVQMSPRYGEHPPWHDVQLRLQGPVVGALDLTFRERWNDPAPLDTLSPIAWITDKLRGADLKAGELPERPPDPPECGPHAVQVLRTYPDAHFEYDFAPRGERSVARGYSKAVRRARRLIYLEDQYLWSKRVAQLFARALADNPELHLVAVVPRFPDVDGRLSLPPNMIGRRQAIDACKAASPQRVHVFDVENHQGTPVYVHAKVCVIDDVWACVGSDNFNRRSWTHDSELSCAVLDDTGEFARDLRLRLMREHLDLDDEDRLADTDAAVDAMVAAAEALDAWYASGCRGPRPPGRLRTHNAERLGVLTRLWAEPAYRMIYDPDGRSYRDRLTGRL